VKIAALAISAAVLSASTSTLSGCRNLPPLRDCGDDLTGQWQLPNEPGRWFLRDAATRIEGYPMTPDLRSNDGVIAAPRWFELMRNDKALLGRMHRRYVQRDQQCEAVVPLRIVSCHEQTLDVERGPLPVPATMQQPCTWQPSASNVLEQWQRVGQ